MDKIRYTYKYHLLNTFNRVVLPIGAQVLTVTILEGAVCMWALVDPNAAEETRLFLVAGVGHPIVGNMRYICTWQNPGTFHLFEVLK